MCRQRLGQVRVAPPICRRKSCSSSPPSLTSRSTRSWKRPLWGSKYSPSERATFPCTAVACPVSCDCRLGHHGLHFPLDQIDVKLPAGLPQGQHADPQGIGREVVAVGPLEMPQQLLDRLRVADREPQLELRGQIGHHSSFAVGLFRMRHP